MVREGVYWKWQKDRGAGTTFSLIIGRRGVGNSKKKDAIRIHKQIGEEEKKMPRTSPDEKALATL